MVRLVVRDDADQVRVAEEFVASGAWVSQLVLAETMWVLDAVYERTLEQIATAVDMLLNHQQLAVQDSDALVAAIESFRKRPSHGSSGCLVLWVARKIEDVPVGTFDRDLAKINDAVRLQ